jgi:L-rhamnose mutarotase
MDNHNPYVIKWEELMSTYQKTLPNALPGEKWILMEKVFDLNSQ